MKCTFQTLATDTQRLPTANQLGESFFQGGQDQVIILWSYFDASKAVCVVDANFQKKTSLCGKGVGKGLPME